MFIGPWDAGGPWNFQGIEGVQRFLERVWSVVDRAAARAQGRSRRADVEAQVRELRRITHQHDPARSPRTSRRSSSTRCIAALMEFNNYLVKAKETAVYGTPAWDEAIDSLLLMLAPEMPHIAEELWQRRHRQGQIHRRRSSIHVQPWPTCDPELAKADTITLVVQVNGKVRDKHRGAGRHQRRGGARAGAGQPGRPEVARGQDRSAR